MIIHEIQTFLICFRFALSTKLDNLIRLDFLKTLLPKYGFFKSYPRPFYDLLGGLSIYFLWRGFLVSSIVFEKILLQKYFQNLDFHNLKARCVIPYSLRPVKPINPFWIFDSWYRKCWKWKEMHVLWVSCGFEHFNPLSLYQYFCIL